ncbi:MAG: V-type ATP synthase subunit E [Planctomycetota bacterium]|jgi:V/A-type H+-transporting ATPase subunit E
METPTTPLAAGQTDLIEGILQDARAEAETILEKARATAKTRMEAAKPQTESILKEARESAETQAATILRQAEDKVRMQKRRNALRLQEEILNRVLDGAQSQLAGMVTDPGYRAILIDWIAEAAIGLDVVEARVNASAKERELMKGGFFSDAAAKIKELTGRKVTLSLSEDPPTMQQGIVLQTGESNVEFNNHLTTRLVRYQSEIRRIVNDDLFD